ncbi:MAG: Asp23/Gls24 family envelope stress response protein [Firmicutes bacterium]|nr:Asp23/Gls24 family envelope stress response protein [Bacillota bacterium]
MADMEKTVAKDDIDLGTVRIADDVVATIATYAAKEIEGVAGMSGNSTSNFLSRAGVKMPEAKGVKVTVDNGNVDVDVSVILDYGYNIPATSSKIQARIKSSIENMTGLNVTDVNVRIAGINVPSENN